MKNASFNSKHYFIVAILSGITVLLISSAFPTARVALFSFLKSSEKQNYSILNQSDHSERETLREEVAVLSWKLVKAQGTVDSLTEFREQFPLEEIPLCIPASVLVKKDSTPHRLSFVVDRGSKDGVKLGAPVVFGHSLIGRVLEVSIDVSRVLYVADPKMRIPVMLVSKPSEQKEPYGDGICVGAGKQCQLELVEKNYQKFSTAYVITSGFKGEYPPGLVIGKIENFGNANKENLRSREGVGMFWKLQVQPKSLDNIQTVLIFNWHKLPLSLSDN